jgi:hypothetical protein
VLSVDFAAQVQQAIREPGWAAGGDLSVHLFGESARCNASSARSLGAARPLVLNSFLGALLSRSMLPILRVEYCLNDACVSPRFMGSGELLRSPTLSDANVWNYRRLQKASLRSELVLGPGVITGLRFLSDRVNDRLLQQGYYDSLAMLSSVEPPVRLPTERSHIEIPPLPSQVVLIAPPVILQRRSKEMLCESSLAGDISGMLSQQLDRKCTLSYNCDAPTALSNRLRCFNRNEFDEEGDYFGAEPKYFGDDLVYADFANLLREGTVLRNGETLSVENWIDQKTASVSMIAVFSIAYNSITTVLRMTWEKDVDDGSGRFRFSGGSTMLSYRNIPPAELNEFMVYIIMNMVLNIMDIVIIGVQATRRKKRQDSLLALAADKPEARKVIRSSITVLSFMDKFDLTMRIGMCGLCFLFYMQKYYSGNSSLSPLDQSGQDLITIDWTGPEGRVQNNQFTILFKIISLIFQGQERELLVRNTAFFTLFFMLVRVIIYMNCHPRISVLYGTIRQSLDDLFHFAIVFMVIFAVFAFMATWAIGSENDKFETFNTALVTQFEMVTGEFPFNEQPSMLELFYTVTFVSVVFIIMVNTFLLAVVVSAYDTVAKAINDSVVERNVFLDVIGSFTYFYFRYSPLFKWPDRLDVVAALTAEECNLNELYVEGGCGLQSEALSVKRLASLKSLLTGHYLFPDEYTAKDWLDYYLWITPSALSGYKDTPKAMLMHQEDEANLVTQVRLMTQISTSDNVSGRGKDDVDLMRMMTNISRFKTSLDETAPDGESQTSLDSSRKKEPGRQLSVDPVDPPVSESAKDPVEKRVAAIEQQLLKMDRRLIEICQSLQTISESQGNAPPLIV